MPQFPELPEIPEQQDLLHLLIQTVALEELSLSALVNEEAEKVQELVREGIAGPIFAEEAVKINESVRDVIVAAGEKEDKLLRKLRLLPMNDHPDHGTDQNLDQLIRSMISYDLSAANLLGSVAERIHRIPIDPAEAVESLRELREIVDRVLTHGAGRDEWRYRLVHLLMSRRDGRS
ncbi:MAG: hypothetical protein R6U70_10425 [Bacillota bacterium]